MLIRTLVYGIAAPTFHFSIIRKQLSIHNAAIITSSLQGWVYYGNKSAQKGPRLGLFNYVAGHPQHIGALLSGFAIMLFISTGC